MKKANTNKYANCNLSTIKKCNQKLNDRSLAHKTKEQRSTFAPTIQLMWPSANSSRLRHARFRNMSAHAWRKIDCEQADRQVEIWLTNKKISEAV